MISLKSMKGAVKQRVRQMKCVQINFRFSFSSSSVKYLYSFRGRAHIHILDTSHFEIRKCLEAIVWKPIKMNTSTYNLFISCWP